MTRSEAEREAKKMLMNGSSHHRYEDESRITGTLFAMEREEFDSYVQSKAIERALLEYASILAPTRLRGLRNALICLVMPLCRMAIDKGADVELSFALSDFYINHIEGLCQEYELLDLARQILTHFYELARKDEKQAYSKPIASAVRYIGRSIYGPCPVSAVATHVGLEQHYFSSLFSKEAGIPPSQYILRRKLEEGKYLLSQLGASVTAVAEALGFCDAAHFSHCFKKTYGMPPSHLSRIDITTKSDELKSIAPGGNPGKR
jgi:AraC-like DNA-binding protein